MCTVAGGIAVTWPTHSEAALVACMQSASRAAVGTASALQGHVIAAMLSMLSIPTSVSHHVPLCVAVTAVGNHYQAGHSCCSLLEAITRRCTSWVLRCKQRPAGSTPHCGSCTYTPGCCMHVPAIGGQAHAAVALLPAPDPGRSIQANGHCSQVTSPGLTRPHSAKVKTACVCNLEAFRVGSVRGVSNGINLLMLTVWPDSGPGWGLCDTSHKHST